MCHDEMSTNYAPDTARFTINMLRAVRIDGFRTTASTTIMLPTDPSAIRQPYRAIRIACAGFWTLRFLW